MSRERARIVPPTALRVNRQSGVPLHAQLKTQVRHLINTGALKPGMQLPTVRQLAGFLRINRNTVTRALAELHRDGYLDGHPGRGTFVADRPPAREGRAARSLERLVQDMLERARQLGFTHEELVATAAALAPAPGARKPAPKARLLLVECNWAELSRYGAEIEAELPVSTDRLLVEDLPRRVAAEPGFLRTYRAVVTTFFHIHEVKRALPPGSPPAVALLSAANISILLRLTELPEGSSVGLVCASPTGSQNILRSIQSAGLWHVTPVLASTDDPWSIARMLEQTRIVVCSDLGAAAVRKQLPDDVELIVSDRTLDRGGLDLLRDLLLRLEEPAPVNGPSPGTTPAASGAARPPSS
ncbi:MAG: GntR family transcriptional regulator [Candidatus Rokubacteria bacterium]|nr:GntR family transcriptional regulator [Candidatus Rokubacteria bacterium]